MRGVASLAGYVSDDKNNPIIFSIMLNGFIQKKRNKQNVPADCINYKRDIEDTLWTQVITLARQ